ncbi:MAG: molybdopterin-dependent oxidoreductase [Gammaproteobacteria bacterium]
MKTHYRACHLCEAICGLEITVHEGRVQSIRGDSRDPLSHGYLCPKATALADLQEDPDRLRRPLLREGNDWREIGWEEAFHIAAARLHAVREAHGADAVAIYRGNPNVHNWGLVLHANHFLKRLGTRNHFSATSADQLPHHLASLWMYGHQFLLPVPDIDRTQHLLLIGNNPLASNGSMMTVPDIRGRLKRLRARGGRLVVIDPRRTETAEVADAHHFIRPGTDAALLLAMLQVILAEGLARPGEIAALADGLERLPALLAPFTPEFTAGVTGIGAEAIRTLARDLATAPSAACHGRMGVSTQRFGTLCQWAIQLLNLLCGNLDRPGGTLLTHPAVMAVGPSDRQRGAFGRRHSRVSGYPEFSGEFPVAALAEEMLEPGAGQVRALVTVAGNPVLSTPNGRRLDTALAGLDFMLAIDIYLNETTRHAHLVLPPTGPLEHDHYDLLFHRLAVHNTARYNPAVLPKPEGTLHDWEIFAGLAEAHATITGEAAGPVLPPAQMLDHMLRAGPYGAAAGHPLALDLARLEAAPHGIDLGPLAPSLAERICHADGRIAALPDQIPAAVAELLEELRRPAAAGLLLFGRRSLRSNNSWMHNSHRLVKGPRRDQLLVHPEDLVSCGIADGEEAALRSRVGTIRVRVEASDAVMRGSVCLPHGFGHAREGVRLGIASRLPGASVNDITDERWLDSLSGNAALNGLPVELLPAGAMADG